MTRDIPPIVIAHCKNTHALIGEDIVGYYFDDNYWHLEVILKLKSGIQATAFNHEKRLSKYFVVLPIDLKFDITSDVPLIDVSPSIQVSQVKPLWRSEWNEPIDFDNSLKGAGPHYQQTGGAIGSVPPNADKHCIVLVGLLIHGECGDRILLYTGTDNPLNTNIATDSDEIDLVLSNFTIGTSTDFSTPPSSNHS